MCAYLHDHRRATPVMDAQPVLFLSKPCEREASSWWFKKIFMRWLVNQIDQYLCVRGGWKSSITCVYGGWKHVGPIGLHGCEFDAASCVFVGS